MTTYIKLQCSRCNGTFERTIGEYTRQTKVKKRTAFFCSLSCARTYKNLNQSDNEREKRRRSLLGKNTGNQYARKGEFTYYLNKARKRKKYGKTNITERYLKTIWSGRCALTNIPICKWSQKANNTLYTASLDRIDSGKGYVIGNVQFVSYGINLAKSTFSNAEMISFISEIKSL